MIRLLRSAVRLVYRLTVGLTVHLLQAGLLYVLCLGTAAGWVVTVGWVTWRTYGASGGHLGWTAAACAGAALGCGAVTVLAHRLARDWLGLTTLSLPELLGLVFFRRPPPPPPPPRPAGGPARPGDGGDGRGDHGSSVGGIGSSRPAQEARPYRGEGGGGGGKVKVR